MLNIFLLSNVHSRGCGHKKRVNTAAKSVTFVLRWSQFLWLAFSDTQPKRQIGALPDGSKRYIAEFRDEFKRQRRQIAQIDSLVRQLDELREEAGMSKAEASASDRQGAFEYPPVFHRTP